MKTKYIIFAGTLFSAVTAQALSKAVVDISASPHVKFQTIEIDAARWTSGFWAERWEVDRKVTIPTMKTVMERPDNSATFQNFRIAAGEVQGKFSGNPWSDGDCYKWIESAASMYAITKDPELDKQMDEKIALIEKSMGSDGYISTNIQLESANKKPNSRLWTDGYTTKFLPPELEKKERWSDVTNHEFYNMGHLITAACIHYRVTGKDNFIKLARLVGDYWYTVFKPKPKELAHMDFNPSNIMAAVELYRTTKDKKYLELADIFVTMRGSQPGGSDLFQSKVPLRKEVEAVGHGVTSTYLWAGAADVVAETGEPELMAALQRMWEDVVNKKMYIHGGISAMHHGESHRDLPFPGTAQKRVAGATANTGDLMAVTTRNRSAEAKPNSIHESFGMAYELPNRTAYNETCGSIGNAMWNWRMLCLTGEAKYAEVMERVFYNAMISAISLDGSHYFYTNPLKRSGPEVPLLSQDSKQRWDRCGLDMPVNCFCCPPSLSRTIAQLHTYAYGIAKNDVWVHLYGSSNLTTKLPDGGEIQLSQSTDYPWDGKILIKIDKAPEQEITLHLRVPSWTRSAEVTCNKKNITETFKPGTYGEIRRRWSAGDIVEINFPMPVELIQSNSLVEENRNQVAVMRGPLVYCLESKDLQNAANIDNVQIVRDSQWKITHQPALLNGVTVLETQAVLVPHSTTSNALYSKLPEGKLTETTLKMIPYYAWNNRGEGQMSVWLPVTWK